jgi:hypothetical protein
MNLATFLGKQVLGILAGYQQDNVVIHVCGVFIQSDNSLRVYFPKGHTFSAGDFVTLHLDNRSGVDEFDAEISVYRASYKGRVISQEEDWVVVAPRECQLIHGMSVVLEIREEGYQFPADNRPELPVPFTTLRNMPEPESKDAVNKVGVLITMANEQPHTTVLAFLSSVDDDIFLITFPQMFKSRLLKRNPHCFLPWMNVLTIRLSGRLNGTTPLWKARPLWCHQIAHFMRPFGKHLSAKSLGNGLLPAIGC